MSNIRKYEEKTTGAIVEAFQWTGEPSDNRDKWLIVFFSVNATSTHFSNKILKPGTNTLTKNTVIGSKAGELRVWEGDYIILDAAKFLRIIPQEKFESLYTRRS